MIRMKKLPWAIRQALQSGMFHALADIEREAREIEREMRELDQQIEAARATA